MRLFLLTSLIMIAFAANSVLNRLALADGSMGPASFAAIRLGAGAVMLIGLSVLTQGGFRLGGRRRAGSTLSLALYVVGFSFAYVSLPAGVGALILFGGVQVTMFVGAVALGERLAMSRWLGAMIAFAGLIYLLWPGASAAPPLIASLLMGAAGAGWGIYSLIGRAVENPLQSTAANFTLALPLGLLVYAVRPDALNWSGAALAVISGAVTSGLGYALWYSVMPKLGMTRAAVTQLTVPVIALAGGMMFLGEALTMRFVVASVIVLGGVALSLMPRG